MNRLLADYDPFPNLELFEGLVTERRRMSRLVLGKTSRGGLLRSKMGAAFVVTGRLPGIWLRPLTEHC